MVEPSSIGRLISIASRQSSMYMNRRLKKYEINYTQFIFLMNIYKTEGLTQEAIGEKNFIDKAAVTRAVTDLEVKGYIIRKPCKNDKRAKKLYLTDKALGIQDQLIENINKWEQSWITALDDHEKAILFQQLSTMVEKNKTTIANIKDEKGAKK
ncbi:MarR family winged helix-turn-helix transcriptional regulator [Marinisporobacter balticus]|uniref:DNA-binding MarR family transcriptional regulator n=1 Tax=Marinisporobacter balticus TaxID=2018667 RepID=A0A4R2KVD9_9FIRM|nr:MarR family transcriptional regulator [Marinisporobacter balticus]TCO70685.1 DNA-binding MarR family transcriptional regulator [Marinisporobacter balticus]